MARFHPIKMSWPTKSALYFSQDDDMGISFLHYTVIPSGRFIPEERAEIEGGGCHRYFSKGTSHPGFLFHLCSELVPFLIESFELLLCFVVLGGEVCIVVRIHAHLRGVHLDRRFEAANLHFHMAELFPFYG